MADPRPKATAFHIGVGDAKKPQQRPAAKRSGPFKFLKKDEGGRATDVAQPAQRTPRSSGANSSADLRRAISDDMRKGESHDHLNEVEIAVPKRPPRRQMPSDQPREEDDVPPETEQQQRPHHHDSEEEDEEDIRRSGSASRSNSQQASASTRMQSHTRRTKHADPSNEPNGSAGPDTSVMDEDYEFAEDQPPQHHQGSTRAAEPTRGRNELLRQTLRPNDARRAVPPSQRYSHRDDSEESEPSEPENVPKYNRREREREWEEPTRQPSRQHQSSPSSKTSGGSNYFRKPQRQQAALDDDDSENVLISQLQKEVEDCKRERQRYRQLCAEVLKEKQELERMKDEADEMLQQDRDEFEAYILEEKKALRKERRQLDEQRRTINSAADGDREETKKLRRETERLQVAQEKLEREHARRERSLKAEIENLTRQVQDAESQNADLRETVRQEQLRRFESDAESRVVERRSARHNAETNVRDDYEDRPTRGQAAARTERISDRRSGPSVSDEGRASAHTNQGQAQATTRAERPNDHRGAAPAERTTVALQAERRVPRLVDNTDLPPAEDFPNDVVVARNEGADGKLEKIYRSEKREIMYTNGTRKVILPSGHVILYFANNDVKRTFPSGKTTYWYAEAQTTHTQLPDGIQIFEFHATNQTEKHYPDGSKEIVYPGGDYKKLRSDGTEEPVDDEDEQFE